MTKFERQTWAHLVHHSLKPKVEYKIEGTRYRLDFAWPEIKVDLEVDGYWHRQPATAAKDALRDSIMREKGWLVFRVDYRSGEQNAYAQIDRVIQVVRGLND